MIKNPEPTRAEANDIYSSLEMGASGLVLAAETAIGDYAKINTLTESYSVKSNNKQKVKILINNSE